ncbi:RNA polymerase sigma-70 factor, ECF subfamily [Amphibacillus marinus]|uniref:RNA polymerase sigma-70 factor, ECF subfamily n=1 Tax=Amphibacillus marinus TaxID=872970 RepID=A0A1H8S6H5_9BACI|nr:sigma-70 family RNA polymerase sigma factor [Amphibacillus marinus]SEO74281.1 RNA polymerase sigma-70 factor, ECF subfamily [Amphibacillus marinus]
MAEHTERTTDFRKDDLAFTAMITKYQTDLYRTALAFLKNKNDAIEAIQEVTFRAYKKRKQLRELSYAKTWLIRIMINYCQDMIKKNKQLFPSLIDADAGHYDQVNYLYLEQAILTLAKKEQELIYLKYFHGYTFKELAEQLNKPEGTIKTILYRALAQLKQQLGDEEGGWEHA